MKTKFPPVRREPVSAAVTAQPPLQLRFLLMTTFMTGAGIIMLELIGARLAGPIFGVSLYIWTALIAVTLTSLSVGYWLGGMLADRHPSPNVLFGLISAAGLMIAVIPLVHGPVLVGAYEAFGEAWRVRLGVLTGSFILLAPPLTLLGMVSPWVLRLALADLRQAGRTAGVLYAVSTVGSVVGTILTGFFLIPDLGVRTSLWITTGVILAPAVIWFLIGRQLGWLMTGGLGLMLLALAGESAARVGPLGDSRETLVFNTEGRYGQVKVLDRAYGNATLRMMLLDGTVQTSIWLESDQLVSSYSQVIERFLARHQPSAGRALLVGLGGGALLKPLLERGYEVDVVELDPTIVRAAQQFFGCDPATFNLIEEDGRAFLRATEHRYDAIVLDVFSGGSQPYHLFSREAFLDTARVLAPGGVLALNTIAFASGLESQMSSALFRTAASVFAASEVRLGEEGADPDELNNILMFFSMEPFSPPGGEESQLVDAWLEARRFEYPADAGIVITDDLNPVDRWCARINEVWRQGVFDSIGPDILLR